MRTPPWITALFAAGLTTACASAAPLPRAELTALTDVVHGACAYPDAGLVTPGRCAQAVAALSAASNAVQAYELGKGSEESARAAIADVRKALRGEE